MNKSRVLICFALKEEAKFLRNVSRRILITGMGQKNAAESLKKELALERPELVLTCGYAGGLNPELKLCDIVFDADANFPLTNELMALGAKAVRFHCAERVAATVAEKESLRQSTGADVVEMESLVMRKICREQGIPSATVRVLSDVASEDFPMDFNAVMTPDMRMDFVKLAFQIARSPQKIPHLMRFQKQTAAAGRRLAETLEKLLAER